MGRNDGIIIQGRAKKPVYIQIYNDKISIKDAQKLWEKDIFETVKMLKQNDEQVQVACIGPAAENKVKFSGIAFGLRNYAARCGVGAVMGAKNLKAIVVKGTKGVDVANSNILEEVASKIQEREKTMPLYKDAPEWHWKLFQSLEKDGKAFYACTGISLTRDESKWL